MKVFIGTFFGHLDFLQVFTLLHLSSRQVVRLFRVCWISNLLQSPYLAVVSCGSLPRCPSHESLLWMMMIVHGCTFVFLYRSSTDIVLGEKIWVQVATVFFKMYTISCVWLQSWCYDVMTSSLGVQLWQKHGRSPAAALWLWVDKLFNSSWLIENCISHSSMSESWWLSEHFLVDEWVSV